MRGQHKFGKLFVVFGPAGSGKTTLINLVCQQFGPEKLSKLVTCTTRQPRTGERDGSDYIFLSPEKFKELESKNGFFETAHFNGNFYGVPNDQLETLKSGQNLIVATELEGAKKLVAIDGSVIIALKVESQKELEKRVLGRCWKANEQKTRLRLESDREQSLRAKVELKVDYEVENIDLDQAFQDLAKIIETEIERGA